ncbi:hypothetical protein SAMN02910298_01425 [Pseudobutyrivibrio sp. YE44]|uniref:hypothetical protein n=1 Tax=Pseudobutyrivibrio sp. YE44 TaxID=1520802 RepID=UPI00088D9A57|nr:hypothetical protein [Pseudobutyrivibrio sp. YE44]SDB29220.1 hypothetical protein SAMN02910298_01425 [Pseudobutyrivibrio sp. YE44]
MGNRYEDAEQEAVTKTFAGEKNKLSKMNKKEKLDYIWTYYKIHIFVVLLILGVIGWGVHHAMTYVQYKFYGMVINSGQYDTKVEGQLHDILKMEKHDGVNITADLYTDETANMGGYGNKLDIYVMAGQLDFAFTDKAGVEYLVNMGAVRDVKDTVPDKLLSKWTDEGLIYSMEVTDDGGKTDTYDVAVDISNSPIHEYFGLDDNIKYLLIADLSGSEEYLNNFYDLLYKVEMGE